MTIGDLVDFKTQFEDADFWLIRKGSEDKVGKPIKEYNPEYIGVKIKDPSLVNPNYLYYYFVMLHSKGFFTSMAFGTLRLKHIRISDIKNLPVSIV
jgi:hypothetical protein